MSKNKILNIAISLILSICMVVGVMPIATLRIDATTEEHKMQNPIMLSDRDYNAGGSHTVIWDCVYFGSYPQSEVRNLTLKIIGASYDNNGDAVVDGVKYRRINKSDAKFISDTNEGGMYDWSSGGDSRGYHYFKYEPIKWRILSINGEEAFLLSDIGLDDQEYDINANTKVWGKCSLRNWLNNRFLDVAFNSSEKSAINDTYVMNSNVNSGIDKVYLLSREELLNYDYGFRSGCYATSCFKSLCAKTSDYAHAMGAMNSINSDYFYTAPYNDMLGSSVWWLRNYYTDESSFDRVDYFGNINSNGDFSVLNNGAHAVRPCLRLKLSQTNVYSYAGTVVSSIYSDFAIGRDNNSFFHWNSDDENSGFYGVKNYNVDYQYYKRLLDVAIGSDVSKIKSNMKNEWGGSCFGIASTMAQNFNGQISMSDLTYSGHSYYYGLNKPCNDPILLNVINTYQLSQNLTMNSDAVITKTQTGDIVRRTFWNAINGNDSVKDFLEKLVDELKNSVYGNKAKVLCHNYIENGRTKGHAVVLTGNITYIKETDEYCIEVYDENSVGNGSEGDFSVLTVKGDFSGFIYDNQYTDDEYGFWQVIDSQEMFNISSNNKANRTVYTNNTYNNYVNIEISLDMPFKITNSDGEYLMYDGSSFEGNMEISSCNIMGFETERQMKFEVLASDTYTINEINEGANICVYNNDDYISVETDNADKINVSLDDGIKIYGGNYNFEAYMSTDDKVDENEPGLVSISAKATGNVTLEKNNNTIGINSDSDMGDIITKAYVGVEEYENDNIDDTNCIVVDSKGDNIEDTITEQQTTIVPKTEVNTEQSTTSVIKQQETKDGVVNTPKSSKIKKIKKVKKSLKVFWKKVKNVSGYQIQYSTSSKFKKAKKITVKKAKTTSRTIKKLKAKKKYYVRIRTYIIVNGKKKYSSWSKKKSQKTR